MHPQLSAKSTLAEWVMSCDEIACLLEGYELDYCCGGQRSLESACADQGLDVAIVLADLQRAQRTLPNARSASVDWTQRSLTQLCDHIEQTHHSFLKQELPHLGKLLRRVVTVHLERHSELAELEQAFQALTQELEPHMMKEEKILFPAIRILESNASASHFPFGSVQNPIRMMEHEHDVAGQLVHEMRRLTNGYTPPSDACETLRQLFAGLAILERDLFQHIHKENNVLFPAAARLEAMPNPKNR